MIKISDSMKEDLRAYFKRTGASVDECERARVAHLFSKVASETSIAKQKDVLPFWRFIIEQLRFVNPLAWVMQIALLAGMLLFVSAYRWSESTMLAVMTAAVLSVAIATPSVFKSFENNVAELEASCQHDSSQVLVSRFILFGLGDVLWMTLAVCLIPAMAGGDPFRIFFYAATPFFAFCALSFHLSRVTSGRGVKACIAAAIVVIVVIWGSNEIFPHWYSDVSAVVWSLALLAALILAVFEAHKLVVRVASNCVTQSAFDVYTQ